MLRINSTAERLVKPQFLFIHGGPGLNSFAEEKFLAPHFRSRNAEFQAWHEPSCNRPHENQWINESDFGKWLDSARHFLIAAASRSPGQGVHLIAHSFGANAALLLADAEPSRVSAVTLVAPSLDGEQTHRNIVGIAIQDYRSSNPVWADQLEKLRAQSGAPLDGFMKEALQLAFQDPLLLTHYFADPGRLGEVLAVLSQPEAAIDFDSFFRVSEDFFRRYPMGLTVETALPIQVLYGERDEVASCESSRRRLEKLAPQAEESVVPRTCHYVQLDEPAAVAEMIFDFRRRLSV